MNKTAIVKNPHIFLGVMLTLCLSAFTVSAQTYSYDENGRLETTSYTSGQELGYTYDDEGSLNGTVQDTDGDGMSDEFEQHIIDFKTNDSVTSFADITTTSDFNNDGTTDPEHYLADTSPTIGEIPNVPEPAMISLILGLAALLFVNRFYRTRNA